MERNVCHHLGGWLNFVTTFRPGQGWMTPFLRNLFEDDVVKNGGNPRAVAVTLNR
jgi:hypothetical protein